MTNLCHNAVDRHAATRPNDRALIFISTETNVEKIYTFAELKLEVMRIAVRAKFFQNPELAKRLLATGVAELIEDSESDAFWGCGKNGDGLNWLGQVLMEVRSELETQSRPSNGDGSQRLA